jgi:hypothetical protein
MKRLLPLLFISAMTLAGNAGAEERQVGVTLPKVDNSVTVPNQDQVYHYRLRRDVFRLTLSGSSPVRILCSVRADFDRASDTVVWDPDERQSNLRYALVPIPKGGRAEVACRSEALTLKNSRGPDGVIVYAATTPGTPIEERGTEVKLSAAGLGGAGEVKHELTIAVEPVTDLDEKGRVLDQRGEGTRTTRLRSLDPTTLATDLVAAFATIAIGRAEAAGDQMVRQVVTRALCDALTVARVQQTLKDTALGRALSSLKWASERQLLQNTCGLLKTLRITELASAPDSLWKALSNDASALATGLIAASLQLGESEPFKTSLAAASALVDSALSGANTTERDAQVLVLSLAKLSPIAKSGELTEDQTEDWRVALQVGIAVLQNCLREKECAADELSRSLDDEITLAYGALLPGTEGPLTRWPELPGLLGRAASVLRPPPGTSARTTAANAIAVLMEVAEHALRSRTGKSVCLQLYYEMQWLVQPIKSADGVECPEVGFVPYWLDDLEDRLKVIGPTDAGLLGTLAKQLERATMVQTALAAVRTLRGVAAGMQGGDVASSIAEFGRVFELALGDKCEGEQACTVPVTSQQLRRGFRIVSAIAAYGASYRAPDGGATGTEVGKSRAEERKKALESLIDSVTDRSDRAADWVVGIGANVGLGPDLRYVTLFASQPELNLLPVSLRAGLALQHLPGESFWFPPVHAMVSIIDLAQYASMKSEESKPEVTKPELSTALRLGGEFGLLWGNPSFPVTTVVQAAWIPRVKFAGERAHSAWSLGANVGIYVPFVDLN